MILIQQIFSKTINILANLVNPLLIQELEIQRNKPPCIYFEVSTTQFSGITFLVRFFSFLGDSLDSFIYFNFF